MKPVGTSRPFTFWIQDDQKESLKYLSKLDDRSYGELIRESLDWYIQGRLPDRQKGEIKTDDVDLMSVTE